MTTAPPRVAIVGAGLIGRAWAIVFARGGAEVALHDSSAGAVPAALAFVDDALVRSSNLACGRPRPDANTEEERSHGHR